MDPRFPPQPSPVRIPLYPEFVDERTNAEVLAGSSDARSELLAAIGVSEERVRLGSSASALFADYLVSLARLIGCEPTVGLPAYICPHFCARIRATGSAVVFLDLDASYFYSIASCDFAALSGVDVLVWPMFFGSRALPVDRLSYAETKGMRNVVDEAQSFPGDEFRGQHDTLISFGRSKRLNASGGGALIFSSVNGAREFDERLERATRERTYRRTAEVIGERRHAALPLEKELPVLLNRLDISPYEPDVMPADYQALREAALGLCRLRQQADRLVTLEESIRAFVTRRLGSAALDPLFALTSAPTIFGIRVPADRRYDTAKRLAARGIQTTWYYYPANRVRAFAGSISMRTAVCDRLAAEILVLPFGAKVAAAFSEDYQVALRDD